LALASDAALNIKVQMCLPGPDFNFLEKYPEVEKYLDHMVFL
jgi:hypothetical protein